MPRLTPPTQKEFLLSRKVNTLSMIVWLLLIVYKAAGHLAGQEPFTVIDIMLAICFLMMAYAYGILCRGNVSSEKEKRREIFEIFKKKVSSKRGNSR